jgi:hypothetical protein
MLRLDHARNPEAAYLYAVPAKFMAQTALRDHVGATDVAVIGMLALRPEHDPDDRDEDNRRDQKAPRCIVPEPA